MGSVIYKYVLDFDSNGNGSIEVPNVSKFLKLGVQDNRIVLWYMVDQTNPQGSYKEQFRVVMTGEYFDDVDLEYIDSVILNVWIVGHVFMVV